MKLGRFNRLKTLVVALGVTLAAAGSITAAREFSAVSFLEESRREAARSLRVKLRDDVALALQNDELSGRDAQVANRLNPILDGKDKEDDAEIERLFSAAPETLTSQRYALQRRETRSLANLNNYYTVTFENTAERDEAMKALQADPAVETVYVPPVPAMPPAADYRAAQSYMNGAPKGVGIRTSLVSGTPAATGNGVKLIDIEYSWDNQHEDLTRARAVTPLTPNGTPADPFNNPYHGTAVMGLVSADMNAFGIDGMAPLVELGFVNVANRERNWDPANAIYLASNQLEPGDVILVEQQAVGPSGTFVPVEWFPEIYDAIVYATAKGIIVIEAAGNGNQDLDNTALFGNRFPANRPDSGAIIVGGGENCDPGAARARANLGMLSSSYGSRVDVQGPGNCVHSLGFGDAGGSGRTAYTSRFDGTSSASAIVASAAAVVSSTYERQNGRAMSPFQLRNLLVATGTPQNTNAGLPGKIGPQPDVEAALRTILPAQKPEDPKNPNDPTPPQDPNPPTDPDDPSDPETPSDPPPPEPVVLGKIYASTERKVKLANGTATVIGNLTITEPEAPGYMSVYPCSEQPAQLTSNLNYDTGQNVAVGVFAKTDAQGYLCFYTHSTTHFIWDQVATTQQTFTTAPSRIIDTRYAHLGGNSFKNPAYAERQINVGSPGQIIIGTVTVAESDGGFAYGSIYPCSDGFQGTSNINFTSGRVTANSFAVRSDANGQICYQSSTATHFIIDIVGKTSVISSQVPKRLFDSREVIWGRSKIRAGSAVTITTGRPNTTVIANLTITNPEGHGYATVYPCASGLPQPMTSNLNFHPLQTIANMVIARTDANGQLCVYTTTTTDIIWDDMGYIPGVSATAPQRLYDSRAGR